MARLSLAEAHLLLLFALALVLGAEAREKSVKTLSRKKREWIHPPVKLLENTRYTNKPFIAKIHSDKDSEAKVEYFLNGPGANKPPFDLFVVDRDTGLIRIRDIVDREKYPFFNLTAMAKFVNGTLAEAEIPLTVTILDMNDNAPRFEFHSGSIDEESEKDTFIMQIEATDDDQAGTSHSEIVYSIISQEPVGAGHMFRIDEKTGKLYVKEPTLDRETIDFYRLTVQGADLGGAEGGLMGTGTVEIKVLDINDKIPTLEQSEYSGSVDENTHDVVVMRIKALDEDLEHTDNWLTVFSIVKGNEENLFSIETDNNTNEGILKLIKPLDFEEVQNLQLSLLIKNVAPFVRGESVIMDVDVKVGEGDRPAAEVEGDIDKPTDGKLDVEVHGGVTTDVGGELNPGLHPVPVPTGSDELHGKTAKEYSIKIAVNNVPEGPAFVPDTKRVAVSEDPNEQPEDGIITVFTAIDADTGKTAEDVSYAKAHDPDNWFIIDEETAEIKLIKAPDSESPFLVNRTYFAEILAISKDIPSKTATGTIAIQVKDSNDHCPTLTTSRTSLCSDEKTVYVTGFDEDLSPNAAPFTFTIIPDGTQGSWDMEVINATSAALHSRENLWPGEYKLKVKVSDAQGLSCQADEVFTVDVCTCVDTKDCGPKAARLATKSTGLSAPAIGLLLLAMCLLLLIPLLLLFCECGGAGKLFPEQFSDLPFDTKDQLISYHTEGRGEDKEVPLQSIPIMLRNQTKAEMAPAPDFNTFPSKITGTHQKFAAYNEFMRKYQTSQTVTDFNDTYRFSRESKYGSAYNNRTLGRQFTTDMYEGMALSDTFLNEYYTQKAQCAVPGKDGLLEYCFEGQGSSVGSLGCCSLSEFDNDLNFLNDLGPKFSTLAEICSPPTPTHKASLTGQVAGTVSTTVGVVEPDLKPKIKQSGEMKHTDIETETSVASTYKSSVGTVSTDLASLTIPRSKVTSIGLSSNISQIATLPRPAQTMVLQQQPVYCTTSTILQPMPYIVQPQIQNTVLLADAARVASSPGLYVVSGSQSPPSGLVISAPQGSPSGLVIKGKSPKSPVNLSSHMSPTLLLPVSQGVSQGSVSVENWKMVGPNPDGNYRLVQDESSPGKAKRVEPGSPRGILPTGAILMKEAAPPQGALSPAAQGSMFTILQGHDVAKGMGVVEVNTNLGQTWIGEPVNMGLELITIGEPQIGIGPVVTVNPEISQTRTWPAGIGPVGMRQVSINQQMPLIKEIFDSIGVTKKGKIPSLKEDKTINDVDTIIVAETAKTHLPVKEEFVKEALFKAERDQAQNICNDTVNENQDVNTYTSEQLKGFDDEDENVEEAPLKEVQEEGKHVQLSTDEGLEDRHFKVVPEPQTNEVTEGQSGWEIDEDVSPGKKVVSDLETNEVSATSVSIQADKNIEEMTAVNTDAHEEAEEQLLDSEVRVSTVVGESSETPPCEISADSVDESEEKSMPVQEETPELPAYHSEGEETDEWQRQTQAETGGASFTPTSTVAEEASWLVLNENMHNAGETAEVGPTVGKADSINIESNVPYTVQDQIHDSSEEIVEEYEAAPLKEGQEEEKPAQLNTNQGLEDTLFKPVSELQLNEVTKGQSGWEVDEDVSPGKKVVSDLETNEVSATSVSIQADENIEEMTAVSTDAHEEAEEQLLDSEVRVSTVVDESSTTPPCETSADSVDESEEKSMPVQEETPELPAYHSEGEETDEWQRQTQAETGGASFTPTSTVAEEASWLVQNESMHNAGETAEVGPTVGKADSINIESNVPYTVQDQIHDSSEEIVEEYEAAPLKEGQEEEKPAQLNTNQGLEDTLFKPVSELQLNEVTKGQSGWEVDEDVSPGKKVVSDLEVSADTVDESEEKSMHVQDQMLDVPAYHSEGEEIDEWPANTGNADVEAEPSLYTVGTIVTTREEEDLSLISVSEETMQVEVKGLTVLSIAPKDFSQKEDVDHQQNVTAGSGVDKGQAESDGDGISDEEKDGIVVEEAVSKSMSSDQDEGTNLIPGGNITDEKEDEAATEEMLFDFSNEQDKEKAKVDTLCTSPEVNNNLVSPSEEEIVEVVALTVQQNINIADSQEEETETETASGKSPPLEDELILDDDLRDEAKEDGIVEEEVSCVQQLSGVTEDEGSEERGPQVEDKLISDDNASNGEEEVLSIQEKCISEREDSLGASLQSPVQQHVSVPDEQDVESAKENTSSTSSHEEEEGIKTCQASHNQTLSSESEQRATSESAETQETSREVTADPIRKEVDSSLISDITMDIPNRQDMVEQELVGDTDMDGLNDVVTSSESLKSSRVATGQVSWSREDTGATGIIFAHGLLHEGETTGPENQNTDVVTTEDSEGSLLFLEEAKADTELEEGLDNARGQVSPAFCAEIEGVDETLSAVLQTEPGSAATGGASFTPTSSVAEEAAYLVQNESVHVTGEEAAVGPTVGRAASINVESKVPYDKNESRASGDQVSRTPQNKSRKSKRDSKKSHLKSPSDKCKQQ